jgi:uncharacterized protein
MKPPWLEVVSSKEDGGAVVIRLQEQRIHLLPQRAIYWEETRTLIVSDAHFGKIGAFRAGGIPLPGSAALDDASRLEALLTRWHPAECLFLGDLFHARYNEEWELVAALVQRHRVTRFSLVDGNHDVLDPQLLRDTGFTLYGETALLPPFTFTHDRMPNAAGGYNIHGHLHPGVRLTGPGGDSLRLPAYVFRPDSAILPAFGGFTGAAIVTGHPGDHLFVTTARQVVPI